MRVERGLWLAPSVDPELGRQWQAEFGGWFGAAGATPAGLDPQRFALIETPLGQLLAKRDADRSRRSWFVWSGLRQARGLKAFLAGRKMLAGALPVAEPLAYVHKRAAAPHSDGVLISRYIEATDPWSFLAEEPEPLASLDEFIDVLAGTLLSLHQQGFRHRDLKAPNLLLGREGAWPLKLTLLDLESVDGPRPVGRTTVVRDLARVCASFNSPRASELGVRPKHWEQLLESYVKRSHYDASLLPSLLVGTRSWAAQHNQRNQKRKRPIT